jgi:mono/diheme cytochrome c family protein
VAALVWTLAAYGGRSVTAQESPAPKAGVTPAEPPAAPVPAAPGSREIYQGWKWYHVYCDRCHGLDANSNTGLPGPDLKASVKALSKEDIVKAIRDGRLPKGMPGWGTLLTEEQIGELYAYVHARANGTLKPGRPDEQQAQQSVK